VWWSVIGGLLWGVGVEDVGGASANVFSSEEP